jgi:hypothetical protein
MATTEALAADLGIKAQSLRAAVSRDGSYFGVRPDKLPNGRLDWPDDAKARLKAAAADPAQQAARQAHAEKMQAGKIKAA